MTDSHCGHKCSRATSSASPVGLSVEGERRAGSHRPITESAEQRPVGTGPTAIDTEDDHRTRWTGGVAWSGKVVRYELIVMNVEIPSCSDRRIGPFQTRFEVCAWEVRAEPDVASLNAEILADNVWQSRNVVGLVPTSRSQNLQNNGRSEPGPTTGC